MPESPTKPFSGIFVSYRRDDSSGHAGRLYDKLVSHFGKDRIFMDIDAIDLGEDFVTVIENAVGSCGILIAVIGRQWLASADDSSARRLDNPNDFVRLEIATALSRDIRVIPVLVQRASMPKPRDLPDDLAKFSRRNAVEISDLRWQHDVDRLIDVLERVLAKREEESRLAEAARHTEEERQRRKKGGEEERNLQDRMEALRTELLLPPADEQVEEEAGRRANEERQLQEDDKRREMETRARAWQRREEEKRALADREAEDLAARLVAQHGQQERSLRRNRRRKEIVIACFLVAIVVVGFAWISQLGKNEPAFNQAATPTVTPSTGQTTTSPPAAANNPPPSRLIFTNKYGVEMVYVPPGEFVMGDNNGNVNEQPAHRVKISAGFYIGKYEVTQAEWRRVMATTMGQQHQKAKTQYPLAGEGDRYPVYYVSWYEAEAFLQKLNELGDGYRYRLPTEAEWEYACRAGTTGDHAGDLDALAWYGQNASGQTHPVGTKQPNAFGLYDMHGNVWEWCQDWYDRHYYKISPSTDPEGPANGQRRITRGGSWYPAATCLQSRCRSQDAPDYRSRILGFRVVAKKQSP